jgi:hypothetical protein
MWMGDERADEAFGNIGPRALGLSSVAKSVIPRKQRGSGGITSGGRQTVKDGAFLLEGGGREKLSFLTLTLPPGTERAAFKAWPRICHHLMHSITRDLKAAGLPGEIVYVSEFQESRGRRTGIPTLHLHLLFVGRRRRGSRWAISTRRADEIWCNALGASVGNSVNKDTVVAASKIEPIRKSSVAYLGKYMSKGCKGASGGDGEGGNIPHPPAWYGISRNLLRRVRRGTRRLWGQAASGTISFLLANSSTVLKFNRWVFLPIDGQDSLCIAWYGDLVDPRLLAPLFL